MLGPWLGKRSDALPDSGVLGRRLPFLIGLAGTTALLLAVFPWLPRLAGGVVPQPNSPAQVPVIILLIFATVILDCSSSLQEEFLRALVPDLAAGAGPGAVAQGHATLSVAAGIGQGAGYGLGALPWASLLGHSEARGVAVATGGSGAATLAVLYAALALYLICCVVGISTAVAWRQQRRTQVVLAPVQPDLSVALPTLAISDSGNAPLHLAGTPLTPDLLRLCAHQFLAALVLWPVWSFSTAFFGESVFGGDSQALPGSASAKRYALGVQVGSGALGCMSLLAACASLVLPRLLQLGGSAAATCPDGPGSGAQDTTALLAGEESSQHLPTGKGRFLQGSVFVLAQAAVAVVLGGAAVGGVAARPPHPTQPLPPHTILMAAAAFVGVALTGLCWAVNNVYAFALLPTTLPSQHMPHEPSPDQGVDVTGPAHSDTEAPSLAHKPGAESERPMALYTSLLYLSQTMPQVIAALAVGPLAQYTAVGFGGPMILAAGAAALTAATASTCMWPLLSSDRLGMPLPG